MKQPPFVSIIIVSYNAKGYLKNCLESLSKMTYPHYEILLVDNGSTDGTSEFVKKKFPHVTILKNSVNLGFSGGHDVALRQVLGDAVLLLNSDTIVQGNLLTVLIEELYANKNIGAVQPKLVLYPQKNQIDSIGSFFLSTGVLYHFGLEKNPDLSIYNKPMEIYCSKAACLLVKLEVIKKTGLFDKDFFTVFEDTDFCHRIWLAGYRIIYTPRTTVYHKAGGTNNRARRSFIIFHSEKNRMLSYIKNLSLGYLGEVLSKLILAEFVMIIINLLRGKPYASWAIIRALGWNIMHAQQTYKKRLYVQRHIRKIKDEDFLPKLTKPVRLSYYYFLIKGLMFYRD